MFVMTKFDTAFIIQVKTFWVNLVSKTGAYFDSIYDYIVKITFS